MSPIFRRASSASSPASSQTSSQASSQASSSQAFYQTSSSQASSQASYNSDSDISHEPQLHFDKFTNDNPMDLLSLHGLFKLMNAHRFPMTNYELSRELFHFSKLSPEYDTYVRNKLGLAWRKQSGPAFTIQWDKYEKIDCSPNGIEQMFLLQRLRNQLSDSNNDFINFKASLNENGKRFVREASSLTQSQRKGLFGRLGTTMDIKMTSEKALHVLLGSLIE